MGWRCSVESRWWDIGAMARQLLWEGIARRKQEVALKLYEQGHVSKSRAAEIAELSLWEFTDVVAQRGTRWDYRLQDAKQELQRVLSAE